jgi:hypothetical protein
MNDCHIILIYKGIHLLIHALQFYTPTQPHTHSIVCVYMTYTVVSSYLYQNSNFIFNIILNN